MVVNMKLAELSKDEKEIVIDTLFTDGQTAKAWYYAGDIGMVILQGTLTRYRPNVLEATNPLEVHRSIELAADKRYKKGAFHVNGAQRVATEIGLGAVTAELYRAITPERAVDFNERVYAAPARISALEELGLNYNLALLR